MTQPIYVHSRAQVNAQLFGEHSNIWILDTILNNQIFASKEIILYVYRKVCLLSAHGYQAHINC